MGGATCVVFYTLVLKSALMLSGLTEFLLSSSDLYHLVLVVVVVLVLLVLWFNGEYVILQI